MEKISLLDLISICFVCSLPVVGICEMIDRIKNEKTKKVVKGLIETVVLVCLVLWSGVFTPKQIRCQGIFHMSDEKGSIFLQEEPLWHENLNVVNADVKKYDLKEGDRVMCTIKEFSLSNPFGDYFPYKRTLKYVEKLD